MAGFTMRISRPPKFAIQSRPSLSADRVAAAQRAAYT
jgi:hypothetical protein